MIRRSREKSLAVYSESHSAVGVERTISNAGSMMLMKAVTGICGRNNFYYTLMFAYMEVLNEVEHSDHQTTESWAKRCGKGPRLGSS